MIPRFSIGDKICHKNKNPNNPAFLYAVTDVIYEASKNLFLFRLVDAKYGDDIGIVSEKRLEDFVVIEDGENYDTEV